MTPNSVFRARIDRLPSLPRRAARAILGPSLDLPDGAHAEGIVVRIARQLHLFAPVHAVAFAVLGGVLLRQVPVSSACDPQVAQLARVTILALYEIAGVPLLTLAAAFAVRRRFRDPYTRHAARVSLALLLGAQAWILGSAAASYRRQNAELRTFGAEVLRCAYDGTPPPQLSGSR
ncbi:MAG TPA: hypothetical protein VN915_12535 [Elusimicrobiota bacterium]|nr:hypothetical protein [Elusimicrobiota bacterium]